MKSKHPQISNLTKISQQFRRQQDESRNLPAITSPMRIGPQEPEPVIDTKGQTKQGFNITCLL
jgi:hypothetical protein